MLLRLTPAEIAFLKAPDAGVGFPARLSQALAAMLTARLRLRVALAAATPAAIDAAPAGPRWRIDPVLATLWLTRRLGGGQVGGTAPFVPQGLVHALDAVLAERLLEETRLAGIPPALAWRLSAADSQATLELEFPLQTDGLRRWARGVIRNG